MSADTQLAPSVVSVMVVHEPGDWFDETLQSLASQDYPNLRHLFLVTPATDDEFEAVLARIRAALPEAFVRELNDNVGFGPAANEVLRLVEGDNGFFLLCHDDIALDPRAVRILVAELFRSNAGLVGPKLTDWDQPRLLQHVGLGLDRFGEVDPLVEPGEVDQEQHDAVRDVFVLPSACVLARADLFRALGGYDQAISFHGDDVDLCWRAHHTGARVVIAPDARVRHRERLAERRRDLNHRALRSRHRMRAVATLTGGSRLVGRSLQLMLVTFVELVAGVFTGRFGEALASVRALFGLLPRSLQILRRRRAIRGQRAVPEREVLGLQDRGSSRLTSYLRGRETETFVGADTTVRRWREASFGPLLAWVAVILALVIGSRAFIRNGVPPVGEFLPFPESPRDLLADYRSSFDGRSFGSTSAAPTGWAVLSAASVLGLFRAPLLMTVSVLGLVVVGAIGAWRLATVFPTSRARIAGMVVYVGTPLLPWLLHRGDWGALAWFCALPWLVHLVRRAAGLDAADPNAEIDLTDGVLEVGWRHRVRAIAYASLVTALVTAFTPAAVVMFLAVGILLAAATVLAGGRWQVACWMAVATVAASAAGLALNLPWALEWDREDLVGTRLAGASGRTVVEVATMSSRAAPFAMLALGLYVAVLAALAVSRAWRLTWSARGAALIVAFGAVTLLAERGQLTVGVPRPSLLAVPVALGLALCAGSLAGGFGADVMARGFGWRQPVVIVAHIALVVGIVPAVLAIGHGAWKTPNTPIASFLRTQLPALGADGDYRVLYVGDPRVLPVPGRELEPGIGYAVVDGRPLDFTDRFLVPRTTADAAVERALQLIADGSTLRAGRLLAPLGIRYVVVPEIDGVNGTTEDPVATPEGLVAAFENQLDIGSVNSPPAFVVFVNESWLPVGAQLFGTVADTSRAAGEDVLVRADFGDAVASMIGADRRPVAANEVAPGVVHVAIPFEPRLSLDVDGEAIAARPGFGLTTAFDIERGGIGRLEYARDSTRSWWLAVQLSLWIAVLALAAGANASFSRRRGPGILDETLIDFGDPQPAGVAGEALALGSWESDQPWDDDLAGVAAADGAEPARPSPRSGDEMIALDNGGLATDVGDRPASRAAPAPAPSDDPPAVRSRALPQEEVDLAALVASVDELGGSPVDDVGESHGGDVPDAATDGATDGAADGEA